MPTEGPIRRGLHTIRETWESREFPQCPASLLRITVRIFPIMAEEQAGHVGHHVVKSSSGRDTGDPFPG